MHAKHANASERFVNRRLSILPEWNLPRFDLKLE